MASCVEVVDRGIALLRGIHQPRVDVGQHLDAVLVQVAHESSPPGVSLLVQLPGPPQPVAEARRALARPVLQPDPGDLGPGRLHLAHDGAYFVGAALQPQHRAPLHPIGQRGAGLAGLPRGDHSLRRSGDVDLRGDRGRPRLQAGLPVAGEVRDGEGPAGFGVRECEGLVLAGHVGGPRRIGRREVATGLLRDVGQVGQGLLAAADALLPRQNRRDRPGQVELPVLLAEAVQFLAVGDARGEHDAVNALRPDVHLQRPDRRRLGHGQQGHGVVGRTAVAAQGPGDPHLRPPLLDSVHRLVGHGPRSLDVGPEVAQVLGETDAALAGRQERHPRLGLPGDGAVLDDSHGVVGDLDLERPGAQRLLLGVDRQGARLDRVESVLRDLRPEVDPGSDRQQHQHEQEDE